MLLLLIAIVSVAASTTSADDCLIYEKKAGNIPVSLGATANECRKEFNMSQPNESHCVMKAYGAINEKWVPRCDLFKQFIVDYISKEGDSANMEKNAIEDCDCPKNVLESERESKGQEFISCWKAGLDESCPNDPKIIGGVI